MTHHRAVDWSNLPDLRRRKGGLRPTRSIYLDALCVFCFINGWRVKKSDFRPFKMRWDLPTLYQRIYQAQFTGRIPLAFALILYKRGRNPFKQHFPRPVLIGDPQLSLQLNDDQDDSGEWAFLYETKGHRQVVRVIGKNYFQALRRLIREVFPGRGPLDLDKVMPLLGDIKLLVAQRPSEQIVSQQLTTPSPRS